MQYLSLLVLVTITYSFAFHSYGKEISFSFDDAPTGDGQYFTGIERTKKIIDSLERVGAGQVIFYSNPAKVINSLKLKRLKLYKQAGHLIGNHTFDHISANKSSSKNFIESFIKADIFLKKERLLTPYFRYPYLRRGESLTKVREIKKKLEEYGYQDGYVTIDNYDWYMNHLFQKSLRNNKQVNLERLKKFYIEILMKSINFYDDLAVKTLKRSPKHVLLLHENDLAALFIDDLVLHLRLKGWKIISPVEAYSDSALASSPDIVEHNQGRIVSKAIEQGYLGKVNSGYENKEVLDKLYTKYKVLL